MKLSYLKVKLRRKVVQIVWRPINFLLAIYFRYILKFRLAPIVILTPGKVGSSSIYRSLKQSYLGKVYHVHSLDIDSIMKSRKEVLESDRRSVPFHNLVAYHLAKKLENHLVKPYVIVLVREPVSRAVSEAYQNSDLISGIIENDGGIDDEAMMHHLGSLLKDPSHANKPDDWFNREVLNPFGLDIFSSGKHEKYTIYDRPKVRLLVLRMEDINKDFLNAIRKLVNDEIEIELLLDNIGSQKWYSESYVSVLSALNNQEYKSLFKETRYYKHFYSD